MKTGIVLGVLVGVSPACLAAEATAAASDVTECTHAPVRHIPLREVPLSQVSIALRQTGCYGCAHYEVELFGDGHAVFTEEGAAPGKGQHRYRLPVREVARLLDSLRAKDIWSL